MPGKAPKAEKKKAVETLTHEEASRKNIPTAEFQSVMRKEEQSPVRVPFERRVAGLEEEKQRRNRDLDPQLVWRGKDEQDWSELVTHAPPIYIQEKVHPKVLIDDLMRRSAAGQKTVDDQFDLFADFNGVPEGSAKTEFYQHDANWSNRMILGDSLQVMASLAEREGLRGQVQCIYIDPPYGIKFNSNFQWSTTSRDVRDGNVDHITREPEQVKAYRDTWRDGIHSYLTYLRDRLTLARDLLIESGSVFLQIGDENVHRVRALAEEVFGGENFIAQIQIKKSGGATSQYLSGVTDFVLWYAKVHAKVKYRPAYIEREPEGKGGGYTLLECGDGSWRPARPEDLREAPKGHSTRLLQLITLTSQRQGRDTGPHSAMGFAIRFEGAEYLPARNRGWTTTESGIERLKMAGRLGLSGRTIRYKRYFDDFPVLPTTDFWDDMQSGSAMDKVYVVQTSERLVQRCILRATDPGDLVLDPTCGSGTTAYVAEQWGRRWITVDTSRVALALARARIMGARYPFYILADSKDGQLKEAEVTQSAPAEAPTHGDIRQGFVYKRVPHITLKSITNNAEIDVIWEKFQQTLDPLREQLNEAMGKNWAEWAVPREAEDPWDSATQELFYRLRAEQARTTEENISKLSEWLHAINRNLKRETRGYLHWSRVRDRLAA